MEVYFHILPMAFDEILQELHDNMSLLEHFI